MRRSVPLLLALFVVRCGDGEGRSCDDDLDCGSDEYCDGGTGSAGCAGTGAGECRSLGEGDSCADWGGGCVVGEVCHTAYGSPRCAAPSPLGGPCHFDAECDDDSDLQVSVDDPVCLGGDWSTRTLGVCIAAGSVSTGGACNDWRACGAPDGCWDGLCRGPGTEGQACMRNDVVPDRPACVDGQYCDPIDHACRRYLEEGERCFSPDDRCAAGLFCYSQEAVCHRPLGEGERCIPGDTCAAGLFCSSRSICRPALAEGEACWDGDLCEEGLFCYSREAVCHAPLEEGEACQPRRDVCAPPLACDPEADVCA